MSSQVPVRSLCARSAARAPEAMARFTADKIASSEAVMMFECIPAPNKVRRERVVISMYDTAMARTALATRVLLVREHVERQADGRDHRIDRARALPEPGLDSPVALDLQRQPLAVRAVRRGGQLVRRDTQRALAAPDTPRLKRSHNSLEVNSLPVISAAA